MYQWTIQLAMTDIDLKLFRMKTLLEVFRYLLNESLNLIRWKLIT